MNDQTDITPQQHEEATARCAKHLGVTPEELQRLARTADGIAQASLTLGLTTYGMECKGAGIPGPVAFAVWHNALEAALALHQDILNEEV